MAKHTITGANLDDIRDRLEDMSTYHPGDARTFADWSLEAGDIITMKREDSEYSMPVYNTKMVWKGTPEITVSSTGKKQLDPVSRVSKQRYGRGGNAVRSQERIYYEFTSEDGLLHSAIAMSEANLTVAFQDADAGLQTQITANAQGLEVEAQARSDADIEMQGQLTVHADEVALVVSATDDRPVRPYAYESLFPRPGDTRYIYLDLNTGKYYSWNVENSQYVEVTRGNRINRGGIISAINDDGTVTTSILGNKVIISELDDEDLDSWAADAKNGEGVFTRYLTVRRLNAQEINTMLLNVRNEFSVDGTIYGKEGINTDGPLNSTGNAYFMGSVQAEHFYLGVEMDEMNMVDTYIENNTLYFTHASSEGGSTRISKSQDGSTLTFTDASGNSFTFNKAATPVLTGSWSSGTLTVSSNPTAQADYVRTIVQDTSHAEWGEGYVNVPILSWFYSGASEYNEPTGQSVYISFSSKLENKTGANSITANGQYSASEGYIGFGNLNVNVQPTLSGNWNSGTLTVSSNPTAQADYARTIIQDTSHATYTTSGITVPLLAQWTSGQSTYTEPTGTSVYISVSSIVEAKTGTNKIMANGTYYPSVDKVGFSAVEVDVQGGVTPEAPYGTAIDNYTEKTTGDIYSNGLSSVFTLSAGTFRPQTSADVAAVTLKLGNANIGRIIVPLQARTGANKITANGSYAPDSGYLGFSIVTVEVPASATTVTLAWNGTGSSTGSTNSVTGIAAVGGSATLYTGLSQDANFSSHQKYVYLKYDTSPTTVAQGGGVQIGKILVNATSEYNAGWSDCYTGVGLDSTTATTLGYGQSITVYAQAYETSSSSSKTNKASRTITAPADRYNNGWTGAYQKVGLPAAGTAATMTVNTPNSTPSASPNPISTVYTVSADNTYAYIKQGSTTVARVSNPAYANGWTAAYQKVGLPAAGTAATMTVSTPNSSSSASPNPVTTTYTVSADNTYAYIKIGSTVYARAPHSAYSNGQAAVTLTGPTWSGTTGTSAGISNTATVSTSGRPTALSKTVPVTLSPGSWSNNKKYVDITTTNGTIVARTEVDASSIYSAGYTAGCTNIKISGWTSTYSGNTAKRYTIISGSGTNAVLGMSFNVTATNGYVQELVFDAPAGAGKAVTMAYRDGYSAGKSAGSNPYPYTKTLKCTGATFTQSQWKYTFEYWNSTSGTFKSGSSYKFHHNSGYT